MWLISFITCRSLVSQHQSRTWFCDTWKQKLIGGPTQLIITESESEEEPLLTRLCARKTLVVLLGSTWKLNRKDNTIIWRWDNYNVLRYFYVVSIAVLSHFVFTPVENSIVLHLCACKQRFLITGRALHHCWRGCRHLHDHCSLAGKQTLFPHSLSPSQLQTRHQASDSSSRETEGSLQVIFSNRLSNTLFITQ